MADGDDFGPQAEQIRREWVNHEIANWSADGDPEGHRYSEYRRTLDALTRAATVHALAVQTDPEDRKYELEEALRSALAVVTDLRFAVGADRGDAKEKMRLWSHRAQPLEDVRNGNSPTLDRPEIETVVGRYLDLPFRSSEFDRLLIDLLVAMELFAFGEEALKGFTVPGVYSTSVLKRRPIVEWLVNSILTIAIWIVLALCLWGLSVVHLFPESWLFGANLLFALLAFASIGWSTIILPRTWWVVQKAKAITRGLIDQMTGLYAELRSEGPFSAKHVEQRARTAADAGVVWPAPLFALLDDINSRGGRF